MADVEPNERLANHRLVVAYDGRPYFGWQRHGDRPTVQGTIEAAIEDCFGVRTAVHGSGRTDRGAHALGQVASVRLPAEIDVGEAHQRLARALPETIELLTLDRADADFHAREDAVAKTYRYLIWNAPDCPDERVGRVWHVPGPLAIEPMRAACRIFVGRHDFASFAKRPNYARASTVREIFEAQLEREGSTIAITLRADGFLYKMVRNIVRAIVKVGEGRTELAALPGILAARDRKAAPGTAPASGLYLVGVEYAFDARRS